MTTDRDDNAASDSDALGSWFAGMREILGAGASRSDLTPAVSPPGGPGTPKPNPPRMPPEIRSGKGRPGSKDENSEPPGDAGSLVPRVNPNAPPDPAARAELERLANDALFRMKQITQGRITQNFGQYARAVHGHGPGYATRAAKESAAAVENAHIAISLAFIFGSAMVGPAIAVAAAMAAKELQAFKHLAPIVDRMKTAFDSEIAKKALDVGIEAMQTAAREQVVEGNKSVSQMMVNYVQKLEAGISKAEAALYEAAGNENTPDALAAIHAAVKGKTPQIFAAELAAHLKRFEEQVAKRYADPAVKQPGAAGGGAEDTAGNKGAAILIKGQRYFALVNMYHEQGTSEQLLGQRPMDEYQFLNWIDQDMKSYLPSGDLLFLKQEQVTGLPGGAPPDTARDTSAKTEAA